MRHFYCYIYFDPITGIPFYIGKGKKNRAWRFLQRNKNVVGRIRKLAKLGLEPVVRALTGLSEKKALMLEELLIRVFGRKDQKQGPLFNHTWGGECGVQLLGDDNPMRRPEIAAQFLGDKNPARRPEVRAKHRVNRLANNPISRPEVAAKIAAYHRKPETRKRMSENNPARILCSCLGCRKITNTCGLTRFHADCQTKENAAHQQPRPKEPNRKSV